MALNKYMQFCMPVRDRLITVYPTLRYYGVEFAVLHLFGNICHLYINLHLTRFIISQIRVTLILRVAKAYITL